MKSKLTIPLALIALLACVATATATAGGLRVIGERALVWRFRRHRRQWQQEEHLRNGAGRRRRRRNP
jgi:hypothetical protein